MQDEEVYFDGGPHYGDLLVNLAFGLSVLWLPISLASLFRALNLRYRFTSSRFSLLSSIGDVNRKDFPYSVSIEACAA